MKNIIIIGSKGYKKTLGGHETFINNLIDNYEDKNVRFYVPEITQDINASEYINNGVVCNPIYMIYYNRNNFIKKAIKYYKDYIRIYNMQNTIIYIIGFKITPKYSVILKNINAKVIINPSNIKLNKVNLRYVDHIVCDSKVTEQNMKKYNIPISNIPYGAYLNDIKDINKKTKEFLDKNNIIPREYYLVVGRFTKENNFELIIKEYMKTKTTRNLVIVSDIENNKIYFEKLKKKTKFETDDRIKFVGPVYDDDILRRIRKNARGYIHGHTKGGTNPSLLEALSITDLNIVYDNPSNKEVSKDCALYFNKDNDSLKTQIEKCEKFKMKDINIYGEKARKRIEDNYTWDTVIKKYKKMFDKIAKK